MDRIEDSEIAPLWAEHFPRRHQTAGAVAFMRKPFHSELLIKTLRAAVKIDANA